MTVGHRSILFAGCDDGATQAAILYSLMACCALAQDEPLALPTGVLTRLSSGWPRARLIDLLPEGWSPQVD